MSFNRRNFVSLCRCGEYRFLFIDHCSLVIERSTTTAYGTSDAATTYTTYNAQGQVATQTDANGNVKTYLYDNAGREISATQPPVETGGPSAVTAYTYDSQNRLSTVVDNNLPTGANTTTYQYGLVGNLASVTEPNGVVTTYSYNKLNRLA